MRSRSASLALAALVLVLAGLATTGATAALREQERRAARVALDRQADLARAAVRAEVSRSLGSIDPRAAAIGSHDAPSPDAFSRATARVAGENLAGATAVVFVVPATTAQVGAVQAAWRAAGATGLTLRPDPDVAE